MDMHGLRPIGCANQNPGMRHRARTAEPMVRAATPADAPALAALRNAAADHLTRQHGRGHWSALVTEPGQLRSIAASRVLVACDDDRVAGTLRLTTKKPWAIDTSRFSRVSRAVYLVDMAVAPERQHQGVGRLLVEQAMAVAAAWPASAIRLDAYDAAAGAGPFYAKCGFREVGRANYRGVPLIYFEVLLPSDVG